MAKYNRKNRIVKGLLSDWYGKERGAKELLAYQPQTVGISDSINEAIKKKSKKALHFSELAA